MKIKINIGCETCSCGSVDQVIVEVHRGQGDGYDYECDNCGVKASVYIEPVGDDEPVGLIKDEEDEDGD